MQAKLARRWIGAVGVGLCLAASGASAETFYKLIDSNGKVTYSEKPPKDFDGKVIRLDIDPNANTATLAKPPAKGETAGRGETAAEKITAAAPAASPRRASRKPGSGWTRPRRRSRMRPPMPETRITNTSATPARVRGAFQHRSSRSSSTPWRKPSRMRRTRSPRPSGALS